MGVDARMFVKIRGKQNWLKEADVLQTAYDLASTIGYETFFIYDADYGGKPHHALSIVSALTESDAAENAEPELAGKVVWHQDGETIVADADEQFVQIHFYGRYYGPDYARGDWPAIRATAEWLERRFPSGEVWYGGDSSGIEAYRLDASKRAEINDLFLASGRKTYTRYESRFSSMPKRGGVQLCECTRCKVGMIDCGGGGTYTFWYCDGCGQKSITHDGAVHPVPRGKDWSEVSRQFHSSAA